MLGTCPFAIMAARMSNCSYVLDIDGGVEATPPPRIDAGGEAP